MSWPSLSTSVSRPLRPCDRRLPNHSPFWASSGELDQAGSIAVGKRADLVLLSGNPLSDIAETRRISGVMLRGRWLAQEDLEQNLEALAASYEAGR